MHDLREHLRRVELQPLAIEIVVAHAEWIVVTTIGITVPIESLIRIGAATALANVFLADMILVVTKLAAVGGEGKGVSVGLPDINLTTAGSELADTSIVVGLRSLPTLVVALSSVSIKYRNGRGSSGLTTPPRNLRSRAHWASQYPVPYLAPASLDG